MAGVTVTYSDSCIAFAATYFTSMKTIPVSLGKGTVHPRHVTDSWHGWHTEANNHSHSNSQPPLI